MSRDSEETEEEEIVFKTRKLSLVSNDFEGKKKELIKVPFVVCTPPFPLGQLNGLLSRRSLSLVRSVLRSPWNDISERIKRQYTRKARQVISVALDDIAPQESENL